MNLRERRKLETARAIQRSALTLARTQEIEAISVEAICHNAGISQRTFFNYFPFKEAAFIVPPPPFPEAAVAAFTDGKGMLLDLLVELLTAQVGAALPDRWMIDTSRRIIEQHPKIAALQFASFHNFEASLASLIYGRLPQARSAESRILAAAVLGALRVILEDNRHAPHKRLVAAIRNELERLKELLLVQVSANSGDKTNLKARTNARSSKGCG